MALPSDSSYGLIDGEYIEYDDEKDHLGSGESAEVFLSRLKKDKTGKVLDPPMQVAAKVITKPSDSRLNRRDKNILCEEAAILAHLKPHRNIVGILGLSPNPKHFVLLLEYVNGGSLNEWLYPPDLQADKRPVDISLWKHRIDIACQIAEGLTYLHTNKPSIAHMDVKCSNILLQYENSELICKISDFGLSKVEGISTRSRNTRAAESREVGSSRYMAPEQYSYELDMSCELSRSLVDIFSFGLLLWELREQAIIFQNAPTDVIILQKEKQIIPLNRKQCPGCSDEYQTLIRDCYKKNPKERPMCSEVLRRLEDMKRRITQAKFTDSNESSQEKPPTSSLSMTSFAGSVRALEPTKVVQALRVLIEKAMTSLFTFLEDVIRQNVERLKAEIGDSEKFEKAAALIHQIASSIFKDPKSDKFRRIDSNSKSFGPVVWRYLAARALFYDVGFELKEDEQIYLPVEANLRGLEILCCLFKDLFPACTDVFTTTSGFGSQTSDTKPQCDALPKLPLRPDLEELLCSASVLLAFVERYTHSGTEFADSIEAELQAALSNSECQTKVLQDLFCCYLAKLERLHDNELAAAAVNETSESFCRESGQSNGSSQPANSPLNEDSSLHDKTASAESSALASADELLSMPQKLTETQRDFSSDVTECSQAQFLSSAVSFPPPQLGAPLLPPPRTLQPPLQSDLNLSDNEVLVEELRFALSQMSCFMEESFGTPKEFADSVAYHLSKHLRSSAKDTGKD